MRSGELGLMSQITTQGLVSPAQDTFTEEPAVGVASEASAPHALDHFDKALLLASIEIIQHFVG